MNRVNLAISVKRSMFFFLHMTIDERIPHHTIWMDGSVWHFWRWTFLRVKKELYSTMAFGWNDGWGRGSYMGFPPPWQTCLAEGGE
ncbi:hypothetical protein EYC84_001931 [Monilinia fructicola]|uniref:Uncharacterized protein n=1 Tax=Monilinia fructicola TaxID=38448 RepID=A0A5M9JW22_MONFR|nr:hypothetical protein EYC84_001931 [Monilinia fructicola]